MNLLYRVSKNLVTKQLDYFGHFEKNSSRLSYRISPHMYLEKKGGQQNFLVLSWPKYSSLRSKILKNTQFHKSVIVTLEQKGYLKENFYYCNSQVFV